MFFDGRYKQNILDIFFFYFVFHNLSFRKTETKTKGANPYLPSKVNLNHASSLFKG